MPSHASDPDFGDSVKATLSPPEARATGQQDPSDVDTAPSLPDDLAKPDTHKDDTSTAQKIPAAPSLPTPASTNDRLSPPPPATPTATDPQLARLQTQIASLHSQLADATARLATAGSQLRDPAAAATVQAHIGLLHRYNETKDVGMGLLGMIADQRGVRLQEVLDEWGVGPKD